MHAEKVSLASIQGIHMNQQDQIAVVLVNLGTPDVPTPVAVRRYLREFLSDKRVVEIPRFIWWWILNCIIVPLRSSRVAKLYQKIWVDNDSPMRLILKEQALALQKSLACEQLPQAVHVIDAMTYGRPSLNKAFDEIQTLGIQKVLVLPLYPQYSATTTAAVYDQVARVLMKHRHLPALRYINQYCNEPDYLDAVATSIRHYWREQGSEPNHLVFSFHGIPQKYARKGDPYIEQCQFTAHQIAKRLQLSEHQWVCAFQSRFGPDAWAKPYTSEVLRNLAHQGIKNVDVVCPGFSADCLETLEEIAIQNREMFIDVGGEGFRYIPALNASAGHIAALTKLVMKHIKGW
jgi:ferrochelatase